MLVLLVSLTYPLYDVFLGAKSQHVDTEHFCRAEFIQNGSQLIRDGEVLKLVILAGHLVIAATHNSNTEIKKSAGSNGMGWMIVDISSMAIDMLPLEEVILRKELQNAGSEVAAAVKTNETNFLLRVSEVRCQALG